MLTVNAPRTTWDVELPDEGATERLAMDLAVALDAGDVITLSGDLGAGKTTLARAVIRYLAGNARLEVPSPTFTLLQAYDLPQFSIVHADLFRVETLAELAELGWDEAADGAVLFVEWPERAGTLIQTDRLDIALSIAADLGPTHRHVRLTGFRDMDPAARAAARGARADRRGRLRPGAAAAHPGRCLDPKL